MYLHIVLITILFLLTGCGESLAITPQEKVVAEKIGQESANTVLRTMMMKLMEEVQKDGPVGAAKFCSENVHDLTKEIKKELKKGVSIKRVSQKNRNPKNAPTAQEQKAIDFFTTKIKSKEDVPEKHLVKNNENGQVFVNYYKPLYVAPLCLNCHGNPQKMSPKLVEMLKKKYPQDKAVGFKPGDFRGVLKVSIPVALLK
ncbi:Tll0287-like domain-containing protein [Candidatus Uabimicrobium amorphum]|uniref:Cytochrome c n=1 Tax=Uabimicrobium amorphum TaxID=2596890 RepID=A0A5S9F347_UABAM|nr:DUF3365 domain-containing protein [Candidatus Uabimicrobium amorphum]BBM84367.1 cytochrome c [Candidatus Uabimicrobium amorphum]